MNYYLSLISLAIIQLYRQSVDAKYVVDTNVLCTIMSNLKKIFTFKFDDKNNPHTNDPKYAEVVKWANTPEGKTFFTAYKQDPLTTNYKLLWDFINTHSQDLVNSKLINSRDMADLLRIANKPINPNDMVRVNGITYAEYFNKKSFKIAAPSNQGPSVLLLGQKHLKIYQAAPGLEIPQSPILVSESEIPEQVTDQSKIKTKLKEFWQRIGNPDYIPATNSYGEMLKKFHNDVTTGDLSLIQDTSENIIKTIKSYERLKQPLTFLIKAKIKKFIDENNPNLPEEERAGQVTELSKKLETEILKKLPISLSIDEKKDSNTILVEAFSKIKEQTDIGDLLHWLDTAHSNDILWTHNTKMITELFEYPAILYALSQAGIKLQIQIGDRQVDLDFSSPTTMKESIFKIFEPEFDAILEITSDELKDSYELIQNQQINLDEIIIELARHLVLFDEDNDRAKNVIQIFKCATKPKLTRVTRDLTCKTLEEEIKQTEIEKPVPMPGYCNKVPKCTDYTNIEKFANPKPIEENIGRNWGRNIKSAGGFLPLIAQFSKDIAQEDNGALFNDLAMVAAPTIVESVADKIILPVLKEQVFPKILENLELIAGKYAYAEPIAQASKIASSLIEKHESLKAVPGIFGRLTNIVLMLSQGNENQDKISIVVNDAIIGIESLQALSILVLSEEIPGIDVITTALMLEEVIRDDIKELKAINEQLPLTTWENIKNFFSILFTGSLTTQTENNLIAHNIYQKLLLDIKQKFLGYYDIVVTPIPDIYTSTTTTTQVQIPQKPPFFGQDSGGDTIPIINPHIIKKEKTSKLVPRTDKSSAKISAFNTTESISRIFQSSEVNVIGSPNSKNVKVKDYHEVCLEGCSSQAVEQTVVQQTTQTLTTGNDPSKKSSNNYEGFVAVAKTNTILANPKVLVFNGKAGDKLDISARGDYTTIVAPENEVTDIKLPEGSHDLMVLSNGKNLTTSDSEQINAKNILATSCSDIKITKKVTVSTGCGNIQLSPSNPNVVHVVKKNSGVLNIKYVANENAIISFEHDLQDLINAEYDKTNKELILEFSNRQQVIITKFNDDSNPLLNFGIYNIQLGKYDESTGIINNLHITLKIPKTEEFHAPTAILNLVKNQIFSDSFQYTLTAKNEKLFAFATNNNNPHLVYAVDEKKNYIIFSSNNQIISNKVIMAKNSDVFVHSNSKVEVDFSYIPTEHKGSLIPIYSNKTIEVYYGINAEYEVNILSLSDSYIVEGSRIIDNNAASYVVNEEGTLEFSNAINLEANKAITITEETLSRMGHKISFVQNISKEDVELVIDNQDIIALFPQFNSTIKFSGASELITNFREQVNKTTGFWDSITHPFETIGAVIAQILLEFGMLNQGIITFTFADGEVTETDLLNAKTLYQYFVETVGEIKSVNLIKGDENSIYPTKGNVHLKYEDKCLKTAKISSSSQNGYNLHIGGETNVTVSETDSIPIAIFSCNDFAGLLPSSTSHTSSQLNLNLIEYFLNNLSANNSMILQDVLYLLQTTNMNNATCRELLGKQVFPSTTYPATLDSNNLTKTLLFLITKIYYEGLLSGTKKNLASDLETCIPIPNNGWGKLIEKLKMEDNKSIFEKLKEIHSKIKQDLSDTTNTIKTGTLFASDSDEPQNDQAPISDFDDILVDETPKILTNHRTKRDAEKLEYVHPTARKSANIGIEEDYVTSGASSNKGFILNIRSMGINFVQKIGSYFYKSVPNDNIISCNKPTCSKEEIPETIAEDTNSTDSKPTFGHHSMPVSNNQNKEQPFDHDFTTSSCVSNKEQYIVTNTEHKEATFTIRSCYVIKFNSYGCNVSPEGSIDCPTKIVLDTQNCTTFIQNEREGLYARPTQKDVHTHCTVNPPTILKGNTFANIRELNEYLQNLTSSATIPKSSYVSDGTGSALQHSSSDSFMSLTTFIGAFFYKWFNDKEHIISADEFKKRVSKVNKKLQKLKSLGYVDEETIEELQIDVDILKAQKQNTTSKLELLETTLEELYSYIKKPITKQDLKNWHQMLAAIENNRCCKKLVKELKEEFNENSYMNDYKKQAFTNDLEELYNIKLIGE